MHLSNSLQSLSVDPFFVFDSEITVVKLDKPNCGFTLPTVFGSSSDIFVQVFTKIFCCMQEKSMRITSFTFQICSLDRVIPNLMMTHLLLTFFIQMVGKGFAFMRIEHCLKCFGTFRTRSQRLAQYCTYDS